MLLLNLKFKKNLNLKYEIFDPLRQFDVATQRFSISYHFVYIGRTPPKLGVFDKMFNLKITS